MADADPEVKIRIGADTSGGEKAVKTLKKVKQESTGLIGSLAKMKEGFERARGAIMSLGGASAVISSLVFLVKRMADSFKDAAEEARRFDQAKKEAAHDKEISDLAASYQKLTDAIKESAAASEHENRMLDRKVVIERELEDARLKAEKQGELDAIDADDPDAAEKRAYVEAKYARISGNVDAARKKQDIVFTRQRLESEASLAEQSALGKRSSAATDDEMIAKLTEQRNKALEGAVQDNSEDIKDGAARFWGDVWKTATFQWGKIGDYRTAEGDAARKASGEKAEKLEAQIDALRTSRDNKLKDATADEQTARRKREEADLESMRLTAAGINIDTADASGMASSDTAERAIESKRTKRERELAEVSRARSGMADTQGQIAAARRRLQEIQEGRYANDMAAARAGDAFELARANGRPVREQGAAYGRQQEIVRKTQDANHALDKAEAEILSTLEALTARLKQFERVVQNGEKRAKADASDAAGGD